MAWGRGGECAWTVWGQKRPTGSSLPPRRWGGNKHSQWHFDLRIISKQISAFLNHVSCGNWKIIQTSFSFRNMLVGIITECGGGSKKEICWTWAWQVKDQEFMRCQRHQQVSQNSLQSVDWRGACSKLATLVLIRNREEAWGVVWWRTPAEHVQGLGSLQLLLCSVWTFPESYSWWLLIHRDTVTLPCWTGTMNPYLLGQTHEYSRTDVNGPLAENLVSLSITRPNYNQSVAA